MAGGTYDIITVGGGLGGSTLAKAMAEHGARVLVLEREQQFKDRVRGEIMAPWGVAETQALGLYELLRNTCARETRWFAFYVGPEPGVPRDLLATTPQRAPGFAFYHPAMQEVLLQAAADAGAEVRRGASARAVQPGGHAERNGRAGGGALRNYMPDLWSALTDVVHWCAPGPASPCSRMQNAY